jgi:hypothetical protein
LAGTFAGASPLKCGSTTLTASAADDTAGFAYVARFDETGANGWAMSWGDASGGLIQNVLGLAAAPDHGVWLTGGVRGSVNIGSHSVGASGASGDCDVLLAKIRADGSNVAYAKGFGNASDQEGLAIATDSQSNVYVTGNKIGAIDFGTGALPDLDGETVFVASFDGTGTPLWSKGYGGSGTNANYGTAIGIEPGGGVFLAGEVRGGINFGQGAFVSDAASYAFLTRFDRADQSKPPSTTWTKYYGGDMQDDKATVVPCGLALGARARGTEKDVILTGILEMPADFGKGSVGPMQGFPAENAFVLRVAP